MNKYIKYFYIPIYVLILFAVAHYADAVENIPIFRSDISVHTDGSFDVHESITYDFDSNPRHGIFRTIPLLHPQKASVWYKKRHIDIDVQSVSLDAMEVPYTVNKSDKEVKIKIGDPNKTIDGKHVYNITYKVNGGLVYTKTSHPDLYWNVTGSKWQSGIQKVIATVHTPDGALRAERSCYEGYKGEVLPCDEIITNNQEVTFIATGLKKGQEMTIAQSLNGNVIAYNTIERIPPYLIFTPLFLVILGFISYKIYCVKTKNNPHKSIIPQYEPYPHALPMYSGVLLDGKLNEKDITAGLIYLAQQGFIKIKQIKNETFLGFSNTDYEITLLRSFEELPSEFHKEILSLLFTEKRIGERVKLSKLKNNLSKSRENSEIIVSLEKAINNDLLENGFFEKLQVWKGKHLLLLTVFPVVIVFILNKLFGSVGIILTIFIFILTIIFAASLKKRRTLKGYKARNHLNGFKEFLTVTDKDRFSFHNAPDRNPETFMKYLPYAIAFGVEQKWAKVFEDIPLENPQWFESDLTTNFSAVSLVKDLGSFSSSVSTSSGASSASSGAGSAGGGAGGGGGGSW